MNGTISYIIPINKNKEGYKKIHLKKIIGVSVLNITDYKDIQGPWAFSPVANFYPGRSFSPVSFSAHLLPTLLNKRQISIGGPGVLWHGTSGSEEERPMTSEGTSLYLFEWPTPWGLHLCLKIKKTILLKTYLVTLKCVYITVFLHETLFFNRKINPKKLECFFNEKYQYLFTSF